MKRPRNNQPKNPSESTTVLSEHPGPSNSELQFRTSHPLSGPRPTGRPATLHLNRRHPEAMPKTAARGDDDVMSQPPAKRT